MNLLQYCSIAYYFVLVIEDDKGMHFISIDVATDYRCGGRVWFTTEELLDVDSLSVVNFSEEDTPYTWSAPSG